MLYESNKCGEISEFDNLWAQFFWAQEKEGYIFPNFHMWSQFRWDQERDWRYGYILYLPYDQ